jgi:hypothetical protein
MKKEDSTTQVIKEILFDYCSRDGDKGYDNPTFAEKKINEVKNLAKKNKWNLEDKKIQKKIKKEFGVGIEINTMSTKNEEHAKFLLKSAPTLPGMGLGTILINERGDKATTYHNGEKMVIDLHRKTKKK